VHKTYDGGFQDDYECSSCHKKFYDRDAVEQARQEAKQRNAQQAPPPPKK
jgi:hypothetical protein